jgi:hypothetical protein
LAKETKKSKTEKLITTLASSSVPYLLRASTLKGNIKRRAEVKFIKLEANKIYKYNFS